VADITGLLNRWSSGDASAFDELVPAIYGDLKTVARRALRGENRVRTLDCTALVHEAYLRLVDQNNSEWNNRAHFFGAAAVVMRRLLVEQARRHLTGKRGAGAVHESLNESLNIGIEPDFDVLALNEALDQLAAGDPDSARVVDLRCFGGLSIEETAEVMGTSASTVNRLWTFAQSWLYRRLAN
jgi:RNA polymerase sigma factor (TIGR02999 family)